MARLFATSMLFMGSLVQTMAVAEPDWYNPTVASYGKTTKLKMELSKLKDGASLTGGELEIELHHKWAPLGVDQFIKLVEDNYFTDMKFFRVIPGFIGQFGLSGDPAQTRKWHTSIKDDPVNFSNKQCTLTFATAGPNTRSSQLFFNFKDNAFLDSQGFSPIGMVTKGCNLLTELHPSPDGPGAPNQGSVTRRGDAYLDKFPDLSVIKSATFMK